MPSTSEGWAFFTPPYVSSHGQFNSHSVVSYHSLCLLSQPKDTSIIRAVVSTNLRCYLTMTALANLASTPVSELVSLHTVSHDVVPPSIEIRDMTMLESGHSVSPSNRLPSHPLYPENTALHGFRPASINARRAACTHIFMERLYGLHQCSICQMPSPMKWVYCCVQDERSLCPNEESPMNIVNRHLKEMVNQQPGLMSSTNQETTCEPPRPDNARESAIPVPLKPWIEKAILKGHYTHSQVLIMRAQRQTAIDAVAAAERHVMEHPEHSADPQTSPIISSQNGAPSINPNASTIEAIEQLRLQDRDIMSPEKPRMFPRCHFRACQTCRPTFRDRTWLSFEDVFAQCEPGPFIDFKTDQRPLMNPKTTCQIGLQVYQSPYPFPHTMRRPGFHRFNALRISARSLPYRLPPGLFITEDLTDQRVEVESKGFRESMKRAFRGMLDRKKDSYSTSISRKKRARAEDRESSEFDIDLFRQLNNELLQEASGIPLPGHDGMDGLGDEEGEIEVQEGVAVTEEGVDLGTADIIMSV